MPSIDDAITEYASAALLRYFRKGAAVSIDQVRFENARDRELLRHHWALSQPVRSLASYLLEHRHETQALLTFRPRLDDVIARGRIDARATVVHRLRSGVATALVADEPVRSFDTGPNQLLAWVLNQARILSEAMRSWQASGSAYEALAEDVLGKLSRTKRIDALREALDSPLIRRRPSPATLRDAARSRRLLYRQAVSAYELLHGIESGNAAAIEMVIRTTLVGPLEIWRRFELAVAMAIGEAMQEELRSSFTLSVLSDVPSRPMLSCGPFDLYWQQATAFYKKPPPEPSEARTQKILAAYGMGAGSDRPDLVVIDREKAVVAAVVEVKFLAGDSAPDRFKDAVDQIVRYTRGYASGQALDALIGRSLAVLSGGAPALVKAEAGVPAAADFEGIRRKQLRAWVKSLSA
jgi:hypothetical protein